jgi:exodeoxyribonuclease VII large subunit
MEERPIYSVGDLTLYIQQRLESDQALRDLTVTGEVSNLTRHSSGHVYFTLKENQAQISCVMFRAHAQRFVHSLPQHGQQVTLRAGVRVYAPHGKYQLNVTAIETSGQGDLHRKFMELKDKLQLEGLFDPEHKQPLPKFPQRIGIVTSPTGAVIRDIIDTISLRYPHVQLLISPSKVQGDGAAQTMIKALDLLQRTPNIDVIILARGGGSLEDLWCFNDENLARAIYACEIPVISGVGHATDHTIADFVADDQAHTPTAAAEKVVPVAREIRAWLRDANTQFRRNLSYFVDSRHQMLDDYSQRLHTRMQHRIAFQKQMLDQHQAEMTRALEDQVRASRNLLMQTETALSTRLLSSLASTRSELDLLEAQFLALDARKVLERGYTVTEHNGNRITEASALKDGDVITTHYNKGKSTSRIEIEKDNDEKN